MTNRHRLTARPPATPTHSPNSTAILRELEGSDVDVDHLADRVARASELITLCREKISAAQLRIEQVTADLDGERRRRRLRLVPSGFGAPAGAHDTSPDRTVASLHDAEDQPRPVFARSLTGSKPDSTSC
jgi:exodeoxyribonuclease VII small subunit